MPDALFCVIPEADVVAEVFTRLRNDGFKLPIGEPLPINCFHTDLEESFKGKAGQRVMLSDITTDLQELGLRAYCALPENGVDYNKDMSYDEVLAVVDNNTKKRVMNSMFGVLSEFKFLVSAPK